MLGNSQPSMVFVCCLLERQSVSFLSQQNPHAHMIYPKINFQLDLVHNFRTMWDFIVALTKGKMTKLLRENSWHTIYQLLKVIDQYFSSYVLISICSVISSLEPCHLLKPQEMSHLVHVFNQTFYQFVYSSIVSVAIIGFVIYSIVNDD